MVAYSFQKRFAPPIIAGTKRGTIRGLRKRHARMGEAVQLYSGMRTRFWARIITDPVCTGCRAIRLVFRQGALMAASYPLAGMAIRDLDLFAQRDGFTDADDFSEFWMQAHGRIECFEGFHITWAEPARLPERIPA